MDLTGAALLATVTHVGWTLKRYRRVSCRCAETSLQSSGARTRLANTPVPPSFSFLPSFTRASLDQASSSAIDYLAVRSLDDN